MTRPRLLDLFCGAGGVDTGDSIWAHAIGTKDCDWRQGQ